MNYLTERPVRYGHTDPAGIVYYPRYFEMISETVEDFYREALDRPLGAMHIKGRLGIPTVQIETTFHAPSFCDDVLIFSLGIRRLGNSSATFEITARKGEELRLSCELAVVQVEIETMKTIPFDDDIRAKLAAYLVKT